MDTPDALMVGMRLVARFTRLDQGRTLADCEVATNWSVEPCEVERVVRLSPAAYDTLFEANRAELVPRPAKDCHDLRCDILPLLVVNDAALRHGALLVTVVEAPERKTFVVAGSVVDLRFIRGVVGLDPVPMAGAEGANNTARAFACLCTPREGRTAGRGTLCVHLADREDGGAEWQVMRTGERFALCDKRGFVPPDLAVTAARIPVTLSIMVKTPAAPATPAPTTATPAGTTNLVDGFNRIGSDDSSSLRIEDESVSRVHAALDITPAHALVLTDLGSTRGTFVNDKRILTTKVRPGDKILVGSVPVCIVAQVIGLVNAPQRNVATTDHGWQRQPLREALARATEEALAQGPSPGCTVTVTYVDARPTATLKVSPDARLREKNAALFHFAAAVELATPAGESWTVHVDATPFFVGGNGVVWLDAMADERRARRALAVLQSVAVPFVRGLS